MPAPDSGAGLGEALALGLGDALATGLALLMGEILGVEAAPGEGLAEVAANAPYVATRKTTVRKPASARPARAARPELHMPPDAL
jgi:hypothetical protein